MNVIELPRCYSCALHPREPNGYCRACNRSRFRRWYRQNINPTPRPYNRKASASNSPSRRIPAHGTAAKSTTLADAAAGIGARAEVPA